MPDRSFVIPSSAVGSLTGVLRLLSNEIKAGEGELEGAICPHLPTATRPDNSVPLGLPSFFFSHKHIFISFTATFKSSRILGKVPTLKQPPRLQFDELNTALKAAGEETRLR